MSEPQPQDVVALAADPLIDEVRGIRKAMSDRFANDVVALARHLQAQEEALRGDRPLVQPPTTDARIKVG